MQFLNSLILLSMTLFNTHSDYKEVPSLDLEIKSHELYYTQYTPKTEEVKGAIIILHGMQEHSGRYKEFASFLVGQGYAVLTYDHLGHGKTARNEEDFGFFQMNYPVEQLVSDAESMAQLLQQQYPDVPLIIMGHSMGSFILRSTLQVSSKMFDAAVIIGTGERTKGVGMAHSLLKKKNKKAPRERSEFVNKTFSKMNNTKFSNEDRNYTDWLSMTEDNRKAFMEDPLCGIPFTNNGYYTLISLSIRATAKDWAKEIDKTLPMLFVSGEKDPIGQYGKGVKNTVKGLQKDGFYKVDMLLYPEMRHEILNEDIRTVVYDDINEWLEEQLF